MKPTKLNVSLVVSITFALLMALGGCGSDQHDYNSDRDRSPERGRVDSDRHDEHHDSDRHDDGRGGTYEENR